MFLGLVLMIGIQLIEGAKVKYKTCATAGNAARISEIFDYKPHGWDGDVKETEGKDVVPAL